jgi:acyl carrier protein
MTASALPYDQFLDLLADALMIEAEKIAPEALLVEELGMQSIDVVQLVEQVEMELDTSLEGLDLSEVETVEELYWELVAGGDDGGDSIVAGLASTAFEAEGLPHERAMRAWLPDDPLADVDTLHRRRRPAGRGHAGPGRLPHRRQGHDLPGARPAGGPGGGGPAAARRAARRPGRAPPTGGSRERFMRS